MPEVKCSGGHALCDGIDTTGCCWNGPFPYPEHHTCGTKKGGPCVNDEKVDYQDIEGNPTSLWKLVKNEPEWAKGRIETLQAKVKEQENEVGFLQSVRTAQARTIDSLVSGRTELHAKIAALVDGIIEHRKWPDGDFKIKCEICGARASRDGNSIIEHGEIHRPLPQPCPLSNLPEAATALLEKAGRVDVLKERNLKLERVRLRYIRSTADEKKRAEKAEAVSERYREALAPFSDACEEMDRNRTGGMPDDFPEGPVVSSLVMGDYRKAEKVLLELYLKPDKEKGAHGL